MCLAFSFYSWLGQQTRHFDWSSRISFVCCSGHFGFGWSTTCGKIGGRWRAVDYKVIDEGEEIAEQNTEGKIVQKVNFFIGNGKDKHVQYWSIYIVDNRTAPPRFFLTKNSLYGSTKNCKTNRSWILSCSLITMDNGQMDKLTAIIFERIKWFPRPVFLFTVCLNICATRSAVFGSVNTSRNFHQLFRYLLPSKLTDGRPNCILIRNQRSRFLFSRMFFKLFNRTMVWNCTKCTSTDLHSAAI